MSPVRVVFRNQSRLVNTIKFSHRRISWLLLLIGVALVTFLTLTGPPRTEDRAREIGSQIRCPVCQGESIADSPSQTARNMMDLVRERISEGRSDQEIFSELLASYSGAVLLDPPAQGVTLWLWLAPLVALVVGLILIRRRFRTPPPRPQPPQDTRSVASSSRWLLGGMVLVLAGAVAVATVGQFRQARPEDQNLGVATDGFDPDSVSNETMEAVIAANLNNPEINGMRLALAHRYFEAGDYPNAFVHYQAVLDSEPAPAQAAVAYSRLGWMVYDGNEEVALGLELIDRGLELVPGDAFALYLKGRITWCGLGRPDQAAELFEQVLTSPSLDATVTAQVTADLESARNGGSCPS